MKPVFMGSKGDDLGDRMKMYEAAETERKAMPLLPVLVRLDGRGFSKFTRSLPRPSVMFHELMKTVTADLIEESNALIGYTQSDEISLVLYRDDTKSQHLFDGKLQKITSTLAAVASVSFVNALPRFLPARANASPTFDCRVWTVPTKEEAANAILWRERDATKNSIQMIAQSLFPHKALQGLSTDQLQHKMLTEKDENWNERPAWFKRGTFMRRVVREEAPSPTLVTKLSVLGRQIPPTIKRHYIEAIEMPPFGRVANRAGVIFEREDPLYQV